MYACLSIASKMTLKIERVRKKPYLAAHSIMLLLNSTRREVRATLDYPIAFLFSCPAANFISHVRQWGANDIDPVLVKRIFYVPLDAPFYFGRDL